MNRENLIYLYLLLIFIFTACADKKNSNTIRIIDEPPSSFRSPQEAVDKGEFWSYQNDQIILSPVSVYESNRFIGNFKINIISTDKDSFPVNIDDQSFTLYSSYTFRDNNSVIKTGSKIEVRRPYQGTTTQGTTTFEASKSKKETPFLIEFRHSGTNLQFDTHYNYLGSSIDAKIFKKKYIFSDWQSAKLAYIKKMSTNDILALPKGEVSYTGDLLIKFDGYLESIRKIQLLKVSEVDYKVVFQENSAPILKTSTIKLPIKFAERRGNYFDSLAFSIITTDEPNTEVNYLEEHVKEPKPTSSYENILGIHLLKNNKYLNLPSDINYQALLIFAGYQAKEVGASIIVDLGSSDQNDSSANDTLYLSVIATKTSIYNSIQ